MVRWLGLVVAFLGAAAAALPPPPPTYPPDFPKEVGGYRMEILYPVYHSWFNRQRKEALVAALAPAGTWRGLSHWNRIVESETLSYDYGVIRADRLDRYCTGDWVKERRPGRCEYRYTQAAVPGNSWNDPALNKAIADSFRPADLARRLAAIGWRESYNDWGDPALLGAFADHVDATKLYAPLVRVAEVGSASCPDLGKAIGGLGKMTLDLSPEALLSPNLNPPHGARTDIRFTAADSQGRAIVLQGGSVLRETLGPVWAAVAECWPAEG